MSHIPLLHREAYRDMPRLQPPKRGPQICALVCVVVALGLLVSIVRLPQNVFGGPRSAQNATWPPEAHRTRAVASALSSGVIAHVAEPSLNDLVVAVGYLLDRLSDAR